MGKYGEDRKAELLELGFLFDNQRAKYGFELVKTALVRYKEIYGNFLVKQKFLIPSGDAAAAAQWPERTWGIKLGGFMFEMIRLCVCVCVCVCLSACLSVLRIDKVQWSLPLP